MERRLLKQRRCESLHLQQTSPAPPAEPTPKSNMTGMLSDEKNLLAAPNQLYLPLRKNGVSNGGVNLQNSFRSLNGVPSSTKVNGSHLGNLSSNGIQPRKMSERAAMSPTAGMGRSGPSIQRPPLAWDRKHLQVVGALVDWSDGLNPRHHSAVTETSHRTSTRASAYQPGKSRSNSLTRQPVRTKNLSGSMAGRYSLRNGQTQKCSFVKPDIQMVQRRTSGRLGSTQMDRGFTQQAQISQRQESGRSISANSLNSRQDVRTTKNQAEQSAKKPPDVSIKRAVNLLDKTDEEMLISAAAYIQNQCFSKDEAKVEVYKEHGAKKLVRLLEVDNEEVQRAAAAALRNVVYKNGGNKKDVTDEDGLNIILNLLDKTHDKETVCQLAGILWNLSSVDTIKDLFKIQNFLCVVTKVILVPSSGINGEAESKLDLIADPKAFLCATACLRNLSSHCNYRRNMRSCENLIDSLAFYTTYAAAKRTPDDQCTENCVCILQNLTYEVEKDWIRQTTKHQGQTPQNTTPKETTCSCFPYRRANLGKDAKGGNPKEQEEAEMWCLLQNNEDPHGVKWLWSGQLVRAYLSLLACSKKKVMLEAAMGALQNLTVEKGEISESVARIINEEKGLKKIKTLLENDKTLKKPALLLMRNLSRFPDLHSSIIDNLIISAKESAELMPILCRILINMSENNVQIAKYLRCQTEVNDILKKKHEGKAEQAVEELKDKLADGSLKEDKTKNSQQLLPKFLKCYNGAKHLEI